MKLNYLIGFIILLISSTAQADSNNCPVILKQSANTWANQQSSTPDIENALLQYGKCVDEDTNQIASTMDEAGTGPLMGGNGWFYSGFLPTINKFTELALKSSATGGTFDRIHTAYTKLYQKQFKLEFYYWYYIQYHCTQFKCAPDPLLDRFTAQRKLQSQINTRELKTYFEKLLQTYPPEQRKTLQQAFIHMVNNNSMSGAEDSDETRILYLYAIFILEPPSGKVFPAPF